MGMHTYTGKVTVPDLAVIHTDVAASAMTDKTIEYCHWDELSAELYVMFTGTLSGGDITILDGIVVANS